MRRAGLPAALLLAAASATAAADPRVDLDRCSALDRPTLERAIAAELAAVAADKRAAVGDRVIVIDCPDAVTAHLALDPVPTTGPIARSLDLGEVPGELRARLIALAVVEVVEIAALVGTGAIAPPPVLDTPARPGEPASGIDPAPLGNRGPGAVAPTGRPITTPAAVVDTVPAGPELSTRRALGDRGGLLRGRAIVPRIGLRIYPARAVPMLDVALELVQGAIAVGITGAVGQTDDPLGTVRPYLLVGTAGLTVACVRNGAFEACASARMAAGLAAATATAADPGVPAHAATAPYLELGGQLELAWRGRHRAGLLAIDAGWAEGLIAIAGMREAARLDGTVIVATIGARW